MSTIFPLLYALKISFWYSYSFRTIGLFVPHSKFEPMCKSASQSSTVHENTVSAIFQ